MPSVGLGIIGLGTVGSGVIKILQKQAERISERVGANIKFNYYCDRSKKARPELSLSEKEIISDYRQILNDPTVDIVIELIGGYEPARTMILEALRAGKHVVTANKAVLAKYWDEILSTAQEHQRLIYFEAAVGGGIPVIQGLNEGLAANKIKKIVGILNGTTNFILTRMSEHNLSFDDALTQAQASGFAEADPTFDIEGIDSAHKLAVLASIAFGGWAKISDVYCEGISKLDLFDVQMAREQFGFGLKLLGIAKQNDSSNDTPNDPRIKRNHSNPIELRVHPTFLPHNHPFLSVKDEYNAISIVGDAVDDVMFYGKGAGQMAAASAVVSDIIFVARHVVEGTAGKLPYVKTQRKKISALDQKFVRSRYYLRLNTSDEPGVLAKISGILSQHKVSIASVYQPQLPEFVKPNIAPKKSKKLASNSKRLATIVLTTHISLEGQVQLALKKINRLPFIVQPTVLIRIEE